MDFSLTTLGVSAAGPLAGRWPSGHFFQTNRQGFLLDCGEGLQIALHRNSIGWSKIDVILITHLHGDHIYGLPGLLTSWALNQRTTPLTIVSPPGLEAVMNTVFQASHTGLPFEVTWAVVDPEAAPQLLLANKEITLHTLPLDHRVPAVGYLIREKERPRTFLAEKISQYDIPFQKIPAIKEGADFTTADGIVIPNNELTTSPPSARSFAYCSDTRYHESLIPHLAGIDMLLHEATFMHDMAEHALISGHSTAQQAAEIAKAASVQQLVLTHYSPRYLDLEPLLKEARAVFPQTELAEEGRTFRMRYQTRNADGSS